MVSSRGLCLWWLVCVLRGSLRFLLRCWRLRLRCLILLRLRLIRVLMFVTLVRGRVRMSRCIVRSLCVYFGLVVIRLLSRARRLLMMRGWYLDRLGIAFIFRLRWLLFCGSVRRLFGRWLRRVRRRVMLMIRRIVLVLLLRCLR